MNQLSPILQSSEEIRDSSDNSAVDYELIESIWKELNGRVDREQIRQAILEANERYREATVRSYIPIFIRRFVLERLQESILLIDRRRAKL